VTVAPVPAAAAAKGAVKMCIKVLDDDRTQIVPRTQKAVVDPAAMVVLEIHSQSVEPILMIARYVRVAPELL
jgi:hypothetical protein